VLWLLTQVWVWAVVAFLLGLLTGWLFWARPLRRRVAELAADRADHHATHRASAG
jgi:hypothetical protein